MDINADLTNPSNKKPQNPSSLFATLPFLPKPILKPERYLKSVRAKRTILSELPPRIANFENLSFNSVYLPMPDPHKKPYDGPTVIPILYGNYSVEGDRILMTSSVILILDEKSNATATERCYILVDTGLPLFKNSLIGAFAAHGLKVTDISTIVLTHTDVDAVGNLNLFALSDIYTENKVVNRQYVYVQKTAPSFDSRRSGLPFRPLCDNTDVFLTPGLTPRDLSVVVKNVTDYGTIAVVGNLISTESDLTSNTSVTEQSLDEEQEKLWRATRSEVVCLADYIVPGHGPTFKVTPAMKASFGCAA
uniref:Lactamase_B domain-containing protein n=1 Tax=Panagrellus redivivus TaxID=6233 RepID=A0A7E4US86_PANRE